jgi:uncharacterized protein YciI
MSYFAVVREGGPSWDAAKTLREQTAWSEHADFMNGLAAEAFVVAGGPLDGGPRTLLVIDAGSEDEIRRRLEDDPWTPMGLLRVASVEPWEILLGSKL